MTSHDIEVLEMLNGEREIPWGAWVAACLEYLGEHGYCTRTPPYSITARGRQILAERKTHGHVVSPYVIHREG